MRSIFCPPIIAKVALEIGIRFSLHHRDRQAMSIFDWIVKKFGERSELSFATISATALIRKGFLLEAGNRLDEALQAYTKVITRFADREAMTERVAAAKFNRGAVLEAMSRPALAEKDYLELLLSFSESEDERLRALAEVSKRRLNRRR